MRIVEEPYLSREGERCIFVRDDGGYRIIHESELFSDGFPEAERKYWTRILNDAIWPLPGDIDMHSAPRGDELPRIAIRIVRYLRRHVYIKDDRMYSLLAVWVIASYFRDRWPYMPLIIIDGVTVAGKSTLQQALARICYRGFCTNNYSSAAIVRLIKRCDISVMLDESLDNLSGDRGADLANLIKSVTSKETPYVRAVPKTRDDVEVSYPYTSMAISVKGAEMPTDIVNRGIRVQMVMKPAKMELGSIAWAEYDDRGTDITPSSIRTDLYNLMCYCAGPSEDGTDWNKLIHEAIRWITTQDPKSGQWLYGIALDIEDAPRISNRLRDIATTLLPVAMAAEMDRDVMQLIIEAEDVHRESTELSMEAQVFKTLVDCVKAEALTEIIPTELDRYSSKEGWIGRAELIRAASKVTTRDVAEALNRRLHEEGELDQYSTVLTRTVTYTLKSLGIPYLMGRGSGGRQSTINPSADGFPELFAQHLAQYDPENLPVFGDFLHRVNRNGRTG